MATTKNNSIKDTILGCTAITLIGLISIAGIYESIINPKNYTMPPGYKLMCTDDKEYGYNIPGTAAVMPTQNIKDAHRRAWWDYESRLSYQPPPPKIWHECNN